MTNTTKQTIAADVAAVEKAADKPRLYELAIERLDLKAEIKEREERVAEIDEILLQHAAEIKKLVPGYTFLVQARSTVDWKRFEADHPQGQFPQAYGMKLDQTAAKNNFPPVVLDAYKKTGAAFITVREA